MTPTSYTLNGVEFTPRPDCDYYLDYPRIFPTYLGSPEEHKFLRLLFREDLWAIVYFILKVPGANHPFIVSACRDVQDGPRSHTLDLWGREHYKSTIITVAESIQDLIKNPEETIGIFSYSVSAAQTFLRSIKYVLETSEILKATYPEIFYEDPTSQKHGAFKWNEEKGLFIKRQGNQKEASIAAHGLVDGMPTGMHYTRLKYDDIVTFDNAQNPDVMHKVKQAIDMSTNLGSMTGTKRFIGTPYHHEDGIAYLRGKKKLDGSPLYHLRLKPSLEGGVPNGRPVLLPPERIEELRTNPQQFRAQHLLDPTPLSDASLNPDYLVEIDPQDIPGHLPRYMSVDPAGDNRKASQQDAWGICVFAFDRQLSSAGAPNLYIVDLAVDILRTSDAFDLVVDMYCRNGRVAKLGVEKVAMSSAEVHIANALKARGRHVTLENKGLVLLRPGGRSKEERILSNLQWPLNNGKIFISRAIPAAFRDRLRNEMLKFPFWHDDGLDALSYAFDMIKDHRFGLAAEDSSEARPVRDAWADAFKAPAPKLSWLRVG